jgi:aminoglycoside phosphotransferase (APT) family kinase protein
VNAAPHPLPGIDPDGVGAWFAAHVPTARPPLRFELIAGGRSNLTYRAVDAGGGAFVLRRPPLHGVLPSAHDMGREHRIIAALHPTPVPVPRPLGLCEDATVTGAPFYVMDYVDGVIPRDRQSAEAELPASLRGAAASSLVEVLVTLHEVDVDAVGLGQLGRREGYLERQLRRWGRQWEQSRTRDLPVVGEVGARLAADIPPQGPATIVHGDYRLDNVILSPADGSVRAVLDWELCTLGDPLADVGLLLVYWTEPDDPLAPLRDPPTTLPGFPPRGALADAYAAASGRDLGDLDYYLAFGYWKLAVILEGVHARSVAGAYGSADPARFQGLAEMVDLLAEEAAAATARAGR